MWSGSGLGPCGAGTVAAGGGCGTSGMARTLRSAPRVRVRVRIRVRFRVRFRVRVSIGVGVRVRVRVRHG